MLRRRKSPSCHSSPHSPHPVMFTPLLCSVSIVTVETNGWFPRQGQVWSGRSTPVTAQNSVGQSSQVKSAQDQDHSNTFLSPTTTTTLHSS